MASIYDQNTDQQVVDLLPPDKRRPVMIAWLQSLLKSTAQWLHDNLVNKYMNGSSDPAYSNANTYGYGAYVVYQKGVYVSLVGGNTDLPSVATSWYKIQDNFIGMNERILYNGQKIVLEYALNRWFGTVFRQPGVGISDIFIGTNPKPTPHFVIGLVEEISSAVYRDHSTEYVFNDNGSDSDYTNMTVNIPVAVYNALDSIAANREAIVRNFIDKYVYQGVVYKIVTY